MKASGDGQEAAVSGARDATDPAETAPADLAAATAPPPQEPPPQGATPHDGAGKHVAGKPDAKPTFDARRAGMYIFGTFLVGIGTAAGTAITNYFQNDHLLLFIALALVLLIACVLFFLGGISRALRARWPRVRRLSPGRPGARLADVPGRRARPARSVPRASAAGALLIVSVMTAAAAAFFVGYSVIDNSFAHGTGPGLICLLGILIAVSVAVAWLRHRPRNPGWVQSCARSWLRSRRNATLVASVAALGLSAGLTFGVVDPAPPAAAAPCPAPTELRVLTSSEILGAIQAAIPEFEQDESTVLRDACYAIDLTAYAAPTDSAADDGLASQWDLATDGPHPDIWIPASTAEVTQVTEASRPDGSSPRLRTLGSIASSPIVVAVPAALVGPPLRAMEHGASTTTISQALGAAGIGLRVPNPRLSETARLGITSLYQPLTGTEVHQITQSGSFPSDSGSLLCAAAQQAAQLPRTGGSHGDAGRAAYLVSEAAMNESNGNLLSEGACATQAATQPLTALYPANPIALDFPFTTVTWAGDSPAATVRASDERAFYNWLISTGLTSGHRMLTTYGLGDPEPPAQTNLPSPEAITSALDAFSQAQPPAHILIAVDDSGPMAPYLTQIAAAMSAVLGPQARGGYLGGRDSFGVWKFPGAGEKTSATLVPFGPATTARRTRVPNDVASLTAHDHSAQFNMLEQAATFLSDAAGPESASSVIMLTDGDSYWPNDQGGTYSSFDDVTNIYRIATPGGVSLRVFVIAFGPPGCAESPSGHPGQSLTALAAATGGTCWGAASADPRQLLSNAISQLSASTGTG